MLGAISLSEIATGFVNTIWSTPLFFLLLGCGLIFSIATKFCQWRVLTHGLDCLRGKYDDPKDPGAITHFQAVGSALSATVGLGKIAGGAGAVSVGWPGGGFWGVGGGVPGPSWVASDAEERNHGRQAPGNAAANRLGGWRRKYATHLGGPR